MPWFRTSFFLAAKNCREAWRDRKNLALLLLSPLLLLLLSRFILSRAQVSFEAIPLAVVNPEPRFPRAGKLFVLGLERIPAPGDERKPLFLLKMAGKAEALEMLRKREVVGALFLPEGLTALLEKERPAKISLACDGDDPRAPVLASVLRSFAARFGSLARKSRGKSWKEPLLVSTVFQGRSRFSPDAEWLSSIFLFALLVLVPYSAGQWIGEMERGSLARYLLAGSTAWPLLFGTLLATGLLGLVQTASLLLGGTLLQLPVRGLFLSIWPVSLLLALASSGTGLLLASVVEKERQLQMASPLVLFPLFVFSSPAGRNWPWAEYLPWHAGREILLANIGGPVLSGNAWWMLLLGSLFLALAGMSAFAAVRFRHA